MNVRRCLFLLIQGQLFLSAKVHRLWTDLVFHPFLRETQKNSPGPWCRGCRGHLTKSTPSPQSPESKTRERRSALGPGGPRLRSNACSKMESSHIKNSGLSVSFAAYQLPYLRIVFEKGVITQKTDRKRPLPFPDS